MRTEPCFFCVFLLCSLFYYLWSENIPNNFHQICYDCNLNGKLRTKKEDEH